MSAPRVVVLGGGPAGVGAAYKLRQTAKADVTLIEQAESFGGNSTSFELHGHRLDIGSHRLHPSCDAAVMADIRRLLGDDLLDRPRHGRIHLRGRWIHFPLKPVDLLLRLDRGFAIGAARDMAMRALPARADGGADTFAAVLRASLGPTICEEFYFPYARKIWGLEPERLSGIQARRRVSASSFTKLARKILGQVPGLKKPGAGRFFYPRRGFGQISESYAEAARAAGAEMLLGHRVTALTRLAETRGAWCVELEGPQGPRTIRADAVWSTLPITLLARLVRPAPPAAVTEAASAIDFRAMLLVYLELDVDRFTEYDAHYFPGETIAITRLSEPKNYAARSEPRGSTVLCAELPCAPGDAHWRMSDEELGRLVADDLARAGLPLPRPAVGVHVRRVRYAYPIYTLGYEHALGALDAWADALPDLLSYGRQGLFAHDNTHHALYMAYAASECLTASGFDRARWATYREEFATHVVED